jgi:hypothetical protein
LNSRKRIGTSLNIAHLNGRYNRKPRHTSRPATPRAALAAYYGELADLYLVRSLRTMTLDEENARWTSLKLLWECLDSEGRKDVLLRDTEEQKALSEQCRKLARKYHG